MLRMWVTVIVMYTRVYTLPLIKKTRNHMLEIMKQFMGDSLAVERSALTRAALVRIQVPQNREG